MSFEPISTDIILYITLYPPLKYTLYPPKHPKTFFPNPQFPGHIFPKFQLFPFDTKNYYISLFSF
ncbi:unnamed protein product [Meloidogyne enterolobii]|uniref:Uncharacterized protein n=1 Tax=Meloidogyne enterolobii TaxID=390850 RepID=A0ACB1B064_MELEN